MSNVLIVGATGPQDEVASYSDTGSGPTFIWAPGGDGTCSSGDTANCVVIASMHGGYQVSEGTSFAVPHVAGVAALLMATGYGNSAAARRIVATADQVAAGPRLDAAAALGVSSGSPALPARPPAAPPVRAAPAPVVAKQAVQATPTPASTPTPAPTPTPTPTPTPSPTRAASPLAAAGVSSQRAASGATGRPASTVTTQMVAFVLFLASAGGASVVWIARRVRV
jgi:subtilisin family serine protease